jgi:hypothetical protein
VIHHESLDQSCCRCCCCRRWYVRCEAILRSSNCTQGIGPLERNRAWASVGYRFAAKCSLPDDASAFVGWKRVRPNCVTLAASQTDSPCCRRNGCSCWSSTDMRPANPPDSLKSAGMMVNRGGSMRCGALFVAQRSAQARHIEASF